jgi:acetyl-CoA carboxylase biotin carboxylase subunit
MSPVRLCTTASPLNAAAGTGHKKAIACPVNCYNLTVFRKVLIANRGEIAVRIIRTLREMNIRSVAVYSDADRGSLHVRIADEAAHIGPAPSRQSYLNIDRILDAARRHGVEAIHPGYGFLSENAGFAAACEQAGIVFIGPNSSVIRQMGSKTGARQIAAAAGAPIVPGVHQGSLEPSHIREFARAAGYPVMLKAVAGGGGKGMRRVDREADLDASFRDASSEAERSFSDGAIYVEKLIERPRHIEIQVFGDTHGNVVHLGERECSIQRRHQKIIEECPSPLVAEHPAMRAEMGAAAVRIARAAGYYNAGTVEFLADEARNFYFLEMNTRLQVEHPVTEWATGVDLVRWQVEIAAGGKLPVAQEQIDLRGSAIECRVYAEDPDNHFFPSPGRIERLSQPAGPGVRVDSGVYPGWTVPLDYDPMLAKLVVWAGTRAEAIARMRRAIGEYRVSGIRTNLAFLDRILADREFAEGALDTAFLERLSERTPPTAEPAAHVMSLAAATSELLYRNPSAGQNGVAAASSPWLLSGREAVQR